MTMIIIYLYYCFERLCRRTPFQLEYNYLALLFSSYFSIPSYHILSYPIPSLRFISIPSRT